MDKSGIIRLKPGEYIAVYVAVSEHGYQISDSWQKRKRTGLLVTKDGRETLIITAGSVDEGCEIELTLNSNGIGKVKYLSSTPRRNYFRFLRWYIIALEILSAVMLFYEVGIRHNYVAEGSNVGLLLFPFLVAWFTLIIVALRNAQNVSGKIMVLFCYFLLIGATISFIMYWVSLISG